MLQLIFISIFMIFIFKCIFKNYDEYSKLNSVYILDNIMEIVVTTKELRQLEKNNCIYLNSKKKKIKIRKISITPIVIFLGIVAIATSIELAGSYIMELLTGHWMWDYTRFAFNFQGRIALNPSVRFGIGGMVFLYILQPLFEKLTDKISEKALNIISSLIVTVLLVDCAYTFFYK